MGRGAALLLVMPMLLTGCADLRGKWVSQSLTPAMARDQFRFLRPSDFEGDFIRASFDLRGDGTYAAQTYYARGMGFSSGAWSLIGDRLIFRDNQYGTYSYRIHLSRDGDQLIIMQPIKGTDVELLLNRRDALVPQRPVMKDPSWWDRLFGEPEDAKQPRRRPPRRDGA